MKFLSVSFIALCLLVGATAFAQQKSPARMALFCDVKRAHEEVLWEKVRSTEFFSKVAEASRVGFPSACMVGKIMGAEASSRVYLYGRNLTKGTSLTNSEVKMVEHENHLRPGQCETVTCIPTNRPF